MGRLSPIDDDDALEMKIPFGKHKRKSLGWIADNDVLYLDYLNGLTINNATLRKAISDVCEEYHREIEQAMGD